MDRGTRRGECTGIGGRGFLCQLARTKLTHANAIFNDSVQRRHYATGERFLRVRPLIENWLKSCQDRARSALGKVREDDSLQGRVIRNASWIGLGYGGEMLLRLGSSLIVTRLLEPSIFGLISIVSIFMTIIFMLSDLGLRPIVLTHDRGDDGDFLSSVWVIQILRGILLTIMMAGLGFGWHVAQQNGWIDPHSGYADPMLPGLLAFVGLCLFFWGFSSINEFRLARHLQQGEITRLDMIAKTAVTLANIILAFFLRSVWALAIPMVLGAMMRALLSMKLPGPKMRLRARMTDIKDVLGHSRWIAITSIVSVAIMSADKLVIGYFFGLSALGVYSIAYTLYDATQALPMKFNATSGVSVLKALDGEDPAAFRRQYYRFRLPIDVYAIAFGLGFAFFGGLLIELMYDPRYIHAGRYLQIFGIALLLLPFAVPSNILIAAQRFKYSFFVTLLKGVTFFIGLAVCAYFHSLIGMVFVLALQRVPEIAVYLLAPGTGIPFSWKRDGLLLGLAGLVVVYLACHWG